MQSERSRDDILGWLHCDDPARLERLWEKADRERARTVGPCVHLRGLVEISNHCIRSCTYCGIRAANRSLKRYRMPRDEIMACARQAVSYGFGTLVLQAGEDPGLDARWLAELVSAIKNSTPLAVTLSLGERAPADLELWRARGADRYLLRFETSDQGLYNHIHPALSSRDVNDRIAQVRVLQSLGYETGSGIMVGIPGQTYASVARDLELFRELDLDMIGIGPYIAHPAGKLARKGGPEQVPATERMACIVVALARLQCPQSNIPSTTALATVNSEHGRAHGLERGANVCMPCLTPEPYRRLYDIYPDRAESSTTPEDSRRTALATLERLGRPVCKGPGPRRRT